MSHEPTSAEYFAFISEFSDPVPPECASALTAANVIRDRRIRNEALEEAAKAADREGLRLRNECGDINQAHGALCASTAIRALKDKTDEREASR